MIRTDKELLSTKELLAKFKKSLKLHKSKYGKTRPGEMHYLTEQGLLGQISDLEYQVKAYSALNSGKSVPLRRPSDLGLILVAARIAKNLTQKELAQRLKIRQQQIQRYEAHDYKGMGLERMDRVVEELDFDFHLVA